MDNLLFVDGAPRRSTRAERAKILSYVQTKRRKAEKAASNPRNSRTTVVISRLPAVYPSNNGADPFHCTAVAHDAGMHQLLRAAFSVASRANFLAEAFATDTSGLCTRHNDMFDARLRRCVVDKTHMYATLAYGSSLLSWMVGRVDAAQPPPEYFLGKALAGVRSALATSTVDNWLLLSVYALVSTELWNGLPAIWRGNKRYDTVMRTSQYALAASRTHLRALKAMTDERGGWAAFDPYVLDSVLLADKYLSVADAQRPVVPVEPWDPGDLHVQGAEETLPELGTALLTCVDWPVLWTAVADVVSYCRAAQFLWATPTKVLPDMEMWLFRRLQALTHRLLNLYHDCETDRRRCVCLAVLTFLFACIPGRGPQIGAEYAARSLYALLLTDADGNDDFVIWCIVVGAITADASVEKVWFMDRLRERALDEPKLRVTLRRFLFLPRQEAQLAKVLSELRQHRKYLD